MKKTKRFLLFAAAIILLMPFFFGSAHADLIYTPIADDFYTSHAEDCVFDDHYYTVVSPGGASGFRSPEEFREVMLFSPGEEVYISYVYETKDRRRFGLHEELYAETGELLSESERKSGWILMDQLFESYSGERFREEYASEIRAESWSLSPEQKEKLKGKTVWFYAYPGGPGIAETAFRDNLFDLRENEGVFTDPYRNTWAFAGRMQVREGKREEIWILLDDPAENPDDLYRWQHFSPDSREWPEGSDNLTPLSVKSQWKYSLLAVGIPLAVTLAGIGLFFLYISRKQKRKRKSQ